jgi:hypothetical protein
MEEVAGRRFNVNKKVMLFDTGSKSGGDLQK